MLQKFYSMEELDEVDFCLQGSQEQDALPSLPRRNSLIDSGHGPWGISSQKAAGSTNAWDEVDCTTYVVRGPGYLRNHKKVNSDAALGELRVVDVYRTEVDVANASVNEGVKTIQRLRGEGETKELIVLNLRVGQIGAVVVWALPELLAQPGPGRALLEQFKGMSDGDRNKRLKVIPRLKAGPKLIKMMVGDNTPAILAKQIPVSYFTGEGVFEMSVNITESAAAKRVSNMIIGAASKLDIELAIVIEAQADTELPEQILGAFRILHADLASTRILLKDQVIAREGEVQRPAFLPN